MGKDIVYDEGELSIAANNILNYADFLSRYIEEYIGLLQELQNKGIRDELICSKITGLKTAVEPYKISVYDNGESMIGKINKSVDEMETADDFRFPGDITLEISALLARFW